MTHPLVPALARALHEAMEPYAMGYINITRDTPLDELLMEAAAILPAFLADPETRAYVQSTLHEGLDECDGECEVMADAILAPEAER